MQMMLLTDMIHIAMTDEQLFREKAEHYIVCYNDACQRHEHCLRHLVAPYVAETVRVKECVNPTNAEVRAGCCPFFKSDAPMKMGRGFTHLYDNMPKKMGTVIRKELDATLGHNAYYKYRNGKLPVTPDIYERIAEVCRNNGWTEPPVFDTEVDELNW